MHYLGIWLGFHYFCASSCCCSLPLFAVTIAIIIININMDCFACWWYSWACWLTFWHAAPVNVNCISGPNRQNVIGLMLAFIRTDQMMRTDGSIIDACSHLLLAASTLTCCQLECLPGCQSGAVFKELLILRLAICLPPHQRTWWILSTWTFIMTGAGGVPIILSGHQQFGDEWRFTLTLVLHSRILSKQRSTGKKRRILKFTLTYCTEQRKPMLFYSWTVLQSCRAWKRRSTDGWGKFNNKFKLGHKLFLFH